MKRTVKTMLVAAALSLMLLFASCAGGGGSLSGNYDGIIELGGFYTIAYKDGVQHVYKKNKAGDAAFEIKESGLHLGDFFFGRKTADSGWSLMDKNGKFIKYDGPKIINMYPIADMSIEKDSKGVMTYKYEYLGFFATLDISSDEKDPLIKTNKIALMNVKGELLSGRYSSVSNAGRVITARRYEKETDNTYNYYVCAVKPDGTQIAKTKLNNIIDKDSDYIRGELAVFSKNALVSVKKDAADSDGNLWDVYKTDGAKLSVPDAFSSAEYLGLSGLFMYTKNTAAGKETYIVKNDYSVEKRDIVSEPYEYLDAYYSIEGKAADSSIKLNTVNETTFAATAKTTPASGYKVLETVYGDYLRGEKGAAPNEKFDFMLKDGTEIVTDVKAGYETTFDFEEYNEYAKDYGFIVQKDESNLAGKIAGGVIRSKALAAGDNPVIIDAENGYALIGNAGAYKLWLPYGDVTVELGGAPVNPDFNGNGIPDNIVLYLNVVKGGKNYYCGVLMRNLKYWDGSITNGNLLVEVAGLKEADIEIGGSGKLYGVMPPEAYFEIGDDAAVPMPKLKNYKITYANEVEQYNAELKLPGTIGYGYVEYTLKDKDGNQGETITVNALTYGLNDGYSKVNIKVLGEYEAFSNNNGPFAVTQSTKPGYTDLSKVWKVELNKNGAPELKEIISGLRYAWVGNDGLYNYYISSVAADGSNEVYSETGKLLLKGGMFYVEYIQNYNAVVSMSGSDYGIIKLNKKGGYKVLKNFEWNDYELFIDGSFLVKAKEDTKYAQLCNSNGRVLEKNAVVGYFPYDPDDLSLGYYFALDGEELNPVYNSYQLVFEGKKEILWQYEVKTGSGASKIFSIKLEEKSLDYSILNYGGIMM